MNPNPSNRPSQIEIQALEDFISEKDKFSKIIKKAGLRLKVHSKGELVSDFLDRIIMKSIKFQ
jgi:hypothetical protein